MIRKIEKQEGFVQKMQSCEGTKHGVKGQNTREHIALSVATHCVFEVDRSPKDLKAIKSTDENKEPWEINSVAFEKVSFDPV